jgi:CBS domain-containing protein
VVVKIEEILREKGRDVFTISESRTVLDAVKVLVDRNIGALVVVDGERPAGILTERDILRLTARVPGELGLIRVSSAMTREMITARPTDELATLMDVMTERRIRHLPVMEGDELAGIISIGDLVNACRVSAEAENEQLRQYIQRGS